MFCACISPVVVTADTTGLAHNQMEALNEAINFTATEPSKKHYITTESRENQITHCKLRQKNYTTVYCTSSEEADLCFFLKVLF